MHDLRRQALLESGKTVSRKARSRNITPASSKPTSPAASRAVSRSRATSRAGSDDDGDEELSDETSFRYAGFSSSKMSIDVHRLPRFEMIADLGCSVCSIDEVLNGDAMETAPDGWRADLADRIEEILTRKGSTNQGREKAYKTYVHLLTAQYAEEEINGKESDLVLAFLKSIREEKSEKEATLASKALAMTLITSPSDTIYEAASTPLKRSIMHSPSLSLKAAAIHTLGTATFYGGASDDEILENMEFLLEIISSDGHLIDAPDCPDPVTAALEEYGLLATLIDDMSERSEDAIEAFSDQLGSAFPAVQIAAGENIALLYEKSFKPWDPDEDHHFSTFPSSDVISDPDFASYNENGPKFLRVYPAYRRTDQLLHTLTQLANLSTHHLSKSAKKEIRTSFSDILNSIEYPTRPGPRYSSAIDQETGKRYGSRMTVKIHQGGIMRIDRWWKLVRLQGLRRVLQGGFVGHYEQNSVVFETLPILVEQVRGWTNKKGRGRGERGGAGDGEDGE